MKQNRLLKSNFKKRLLCGNCLDKMKLLKSNYVDTIITDPPYGISFMGKKWDYAVPSINIWKECLRVLKPGGTALIFAGSRTQHRMTVNIEDAGFIIKDVIMWIYGSGFPKATDISKQLNKGQKRKIYYETKLWNGWKSHGLKPAYEPIIIAMKPNEGSYAKNALKYNVAGLNINGSRIPTNDNCGRQQKDGPMPPKYGFNSNKMGNRYQKGNKKGRYPANVIFDEEAGKLLDKQSGNRKSGSSNGNAKIGVEGINIPLRRGNLIPRNDIGGASRFFYCAKVSKRERGKGNTHPTVKPLKLMEYLCVLTKTPTGGIVLDPFMGSGTTGIACKNTNRKFIGIEINKKYYKIAKKRLDI